MWRLSVVLSSRVVSSVSTVRVMRARIGGRGMNERLARTVGYVVTAAWAISFVLSIFEKNYNPPPSVAPLMTMVAGAAYAVPLLRREGRRKK